MKTSQDPCSSLTGDKRAVAQKRRGEAWCCAECAVFCDRILGSGSSPTAMKMAAGKVALAGAALALALQCVAAVPVTLSSTKDADNVSIVFNNVRVYDGKSDQLTGPMRVSISGDSISSIQSMKCVGRDRDAEFQAICLSECSWPLDALDKLSPVPFTHSMPVHHSPAAGKWVNCRRMRRRK